MVLVGMDVAGMDVAREEWGKRLVFVVSLDRVSRRRMREGWHPDAGAGLRTQGREGVERWREVGEGRRAGGLCWEWGRCGIVS